MYDFMMTEVEERDGSTEGARSQGVFTMCILFDLRYYSLIDVVSWIINNMDEIMKFVPLPTILQYICHRYFSEMPKFKMRAMLERS